MNNCGIKKLMLPALAIAALAGGTQAAKVASYPMNAPGTEFPVECRGKAMLIDGADGKAWRTDGYTSWGRAQLASGLVNGNDMTASVRFAIDTYTIIDHERGEISDNNVQVEIVSCLDEGARSGFGLFMGRTGKYSVKVYVGGQLVTVHGDGVLPLWEWTDVSIVVSGQVVKLYKNGSLVKTGTASSSGVKVGGTTLYIGRGPNQNAQLGGANLCTFNGAIDDISIWNEAITPSFSPRYADLNLPADHYDSDRMRARFHAQPGMNWTNETHGLYYNPADGKYHAFFQKTGSAPIMSHQHWGHITSTDLVTWRDEKPALAPGESYDIKGCWSGCVFSDQQITGGKPAILYTGVDWTQPYAAYATCDDTSNMRNWTKAANNPIVRLASPESDPHFRDTYFFRTDANNAYMIIGSQDAVQLYRYNNGSWTRNGNFYNCQDGVDRGFTEMPNITKIGSKWIMTTTPLSSAWGTVCLYRTGEIGSNGQFSNYTAARKVDFFACDGYGLMSPSVGTDKDGNVIALGIVADKLPTQRNIDHGYAHLYSLPRVWTLVNGDLYQKPHESIRTRRSATLTKSESNLQLNGAVNLYPVSGREAEVCASFVVGESTFGFNFYKNAKGKGAVLSYNPNTREMKIDFGTVARYDDDMHKNSFSHTFAANEVPAKGGEMKINMFIDHSIIDIFVNDRFAASVRLFVTDDTAEFIEVFSNGETTVRNLEAYVLGEGDATPGVEPEDPRLPDVLETTGRVAMYVGYANESELAANAQEKAAYDHFAATYGPDKVIFAGNESKISVTDYDMVWVNCDRRNIGQGFGNLPQAFRGNLVSVLKNFVANGGNLYLSKHAVQIATEMGRIEEPSIFGDGAGEFKDDVWAVNVAHYGNDWSGHNLFSGLSVESTDWGGMTIALMSGSHNREDHNCMWNVRDRYDEFCSRWNAEVLGTWGHNGGQDGAGIVLLYPNRPANGQLRATDSRDVADRKGSILLNGLAAYEWAPSGGTNNSHANIVRLTDNIISYLSPVSQIPTNSVSLTDSDTDCAPRYFTLQGVEVSTPQPGSVYVVVRNGHAAKIVF